MTFALPKATLATQLRLLHLHQLLQHNKIMSRNNKPLPTKQELLEIFEYDKQSGVLTWKPRKFSSLLANGWNSKYANKIVGVKNSAGYLVLSINNTKYLAHRIIWKMINNEEPVVVDHIDGNPLNNSIDNLRAADESLSSFNKRLSQKRFPRGVQPNGSRYMARLAGSHLGTYATPEEAHAVYCAAAQQRFNCVPNPLQ